MGAAVGAVADERGHDVVARFNSDSPFEESDSGDLQGVDAAIDFSLPSRAARHIEIYCRSGTSAVVGTTGWYDRLDDVREWVNEHEGSVLYAPNFSLGVAVLVRALQAVTPVLERLPEYDPFVHEIHHVRKVDSPSGTASMLAGVLIDGLSRKKRMETETQHGRIGEGALHVTSSRVGGVFGKHTIGIDSPYDTIELIHEAKNRRGFAFGAVQAAEWLQGKRGLYTLEDLLADWLKETGDRREKVPSGGARAFE